MAKGLFTQCACVLLKRPVKISELERPLGGFKIRGKAEALESLAFSGPSLLLAFRPKVNGYVMVDVVACEWPDEMGTPKKEPTIFGAWATGQFGPLTFPGSLERAGRQCWGWDLAKTIAKQHHAFVRIRSSYAIGGKKNAPIVPLNYDPVVELSFVTKIAFALLSLPDALSYFNPGGEVLASQEGVQESLEHACSSHLPPLELWANVRFFELESGWSIMDTIGNEQMDVNDVQACLPPGRRYDPLEVMVFLRDVSWSLVNWGQKIRERDIREGPGGVQWKAKFIDKASAEPQRRILSWFPLDGSRTPN